MSDCPPRTVVVNLAFHRRGGGGDDENITSPAVVVNRAFHRHRGGGDDACLRDDNAVMYYSRRRGAGRARRLPLIQVIGNLEDDPA
jgi:hypothetical protein